MIQAAALLPIAPLLLLPFILIFFVAVFPIWLVALIIVGALRGIMRLIARDSAPTKMIERVFHWVVTFGGFTETYLKKPDAP